MSASPGGNNALFNNCWFCETRPAGQSLSTRVFLYKESGFLDVYGSQVVNLVKQYVPQKLPDAIEAVQKAQRGDSIAQMRAEHTIETIAASHPSAAAALQQLKLQEAASTIGSIRFRTIAIDVPRCTTCSEKHRRITRLS